MVAVCSKFVFKLLLGCWVYILCLVLIIVAVCSKFARPLLLQVWVGSVYV